MMNTCQTTHCKTYLLNLNNQQMFMPRNIDVIIIMHNYVHGNINI